MARLISVATPSDAVHPPAVINSTPAQMDNRSAPKKYVPEGYGQTADFFVAVFVRAPEFQNTLVPTTFDERFAFLLAGIDSVIRKAKKPEALELLQQAKSEVIACRDAFLANVDGNDEKRRAIKHRLQSAYNDLYKKAGQLLRAGHEITPDDDVDE